MRDDEKEFFLRCVNEIRNHGIDEKREKKPRDIINESGFPIHHKRAWYLLEKWTGKGWYDYGVCLDLGWITEKGNEIANTWSKIERNTDILQDVLSKRVGGRNE